MCEAPNIPVIREIIFALANTVERIKALFAHGESVVGTEIQGNILAVYLHVSTGFIDPLTLAAIISILIGLGFLVVKAIELVKAIGPIGVTALSVGLFILVAGVIVVPVISGIAAWRKTK